MEYINHTVGDLMVNQRKRDGYIDATALTKAYERQTGKRKNASQWFGNDRTNNYLELLSDTTKLEVYELVQTTNKKTWIHPRLAISFAMWLSPEFEMMVSEWVENWLLKGITPTIQLHPYQRVWYQRLMLFEQKTKLPKGKWCVFEQIGKLMRDLEAKNVRLHDRATIDISVGRSWCHWLKENRPNFEIEQYVHHFPDSRGEQLANVYSFELLGEFHKWLEDTYIPDKFPQYVRKLSTPEECKLISEAIGYEIKPVQGKLKGNPKKQQLEDEILEDTETTQSLESEQNSKQEKETAKQVREGWYESLTVMSKNGDDRLEKGWEAMIPQWDKEEWEW